MAGLDYLLAGVSGGLGGIVDAYKMRIEQESDRAKVQQAAFNQLNENSLAREKIKAAKEASVEAAARAADSRQLELDKFTEQKRATAERERVTKSYMLTPQDKANLNWLVLDQGYPSKGTLPRGREKPKILADMAGTQRAALARGEKITPISSTDVLHKGKMARSGTLNQAQITQSLAQFPQFYEAINKYQKAMDKVNPGKFIPINKIKQAYTTKYVSPKDSEYAKKLKLAKGAAPPGCGARPDNCPLFVRRRWLPLS